MLNFMPIKSKVDLERTYAKMASWMLMATPFDRGEVHAQRVTTPEMVTRELLGVNLQFVVPETSKAWENIITPSSGWAEDHFQERVSGEPLNPPPSNEWWPYAQSGNAEHKKDEKFSHTYPERFWPKFANTGGTMADSERVSAVPHVGIRFEYGDLHDLLDLLNKNPRTRQAFLPVWFPEDLRAAKIGERVPCTLGYHFLMNHLGKLECTYYMRSCDMVRFFRDDVYMAGRLLQWVAEDLDLKPDQLNIHIANLHTFMGDQTFLENAKRYDSRSDYNFGAL